MSHIKSFLGTGWSFPPSFDRERGTVTMVSDEVDIRQSLEIILFTSVGERVMRPTFGSTLQESFFDAIDSVSIDIMKDAIDQAILNFEPRVTLNELEIETSDINDGVLKINLDYTIRGINVRTNIVFPFYFKEGTNILGM
jgi:phage baseplate assembly protein W